MTILKMRYDQKNGVIRSHRQELMNGKIISDSIDDFEELANELKCFYSVLLHYNVNLQYFSGEVVQDIIAPRLSKLMYAEFTNFTRSKGLIDETAEYLPQLLTSVGDKIIFWKLQLGSNLAQGNSKIGVRHSLALTSNSEKRPHSNYRGNNFRNFNENKNDNEGNPPKIYGVSFVRRKGMSLFSTAKNLRILA